MKHHDCRALFFYGNSLFIVRLLCGEDPPFVGLVYVRVVWPRMGAQMLVSRSRELRDLVEL